MNATELSPTKRDGIGSFTRALSANVMENVALPWHLERMSDVDSVFEDLQGNGVAIPKELIEAFGFRNMTFFKLHSYSPNDLYLARINRFPQDFGKRKPDRYADAEVIIHLIKRSDPYTGHTTPIQLGLAAPMILPLVPSGAVSRGVALTYNLQDEQAWEQIRLTITDKEYRALEFPLTENGEEEENLLFVSHLATRPVPDNTNTFFDPLPSDMPSRDLLTPAIAAITGVAETGRHQHSIVFTNDQGVFPGLSRHWLQLAPEERYGATHEIGFFSFLDASQRQTVGFVEPASVEITIPFSLLPTPLAKAA